MRKFRFYLGILIPWIAAWGLALFWMFATPEENRQLADRLDMQRSLDKVRCDINDLESLIYTTHVDSMLVLFDSNTENDVVRLGELSNLLAASSDRINNSVQAERQVLNALWERTSFPRRGLDVRLDAQYGQVVGLVDQYITYLSQVIDILANEDGNTEPNWEMEALSSILVDMNKTTLRSQQRLEQIATRATILQKEQLLHQQALQEEGVDYYRLVMIILSNVFFLAILYLLIYKLMHYRNVFNKLNSDMIQQKEENKRLGILERRVEQLTDEKQKLDQQLSLTRLYQENLANNIRLGMLMCNGSHELLSFNASAAELLELDKNNINQDITKQKWWGYLDRGKQLQAALNSVEKEPSTVKVDTMILDRPGQEKKSLDIVVSPFISESGKQNGALILIDDVTLENNMRERLMESERLATVGRLAAQVAHEIRNPLSSISLNTELLEDEIGPGGNEHESKSLVASIQKEVHRLSEITERYLNLARPQKSEHSNCNINQLVQECISFCARELKSNHVELSLNLAAEPLMISVDAGQIRQALLNIMRNGWEAMPDGGSLTIVTKKADNKIILRISDSGKGVDVKLRKTIFDPFFTTKGEGTGLGLAITSQIAKENNATIAYRDLPGFGATFELEFTVSG